MKLSAKQIKAAAMAARACGLDDGQRRLVQANIGGALSLRAATWTREGYCALMGWYEDKCPAKTLPGFTAGYWAGQDKTGGPDAALRHRLRQAAAAIGWDAARLDEFLAGPHMSAGRCLAVKSIARRRGGRHG